jgi:two-component system sensor histidine kinase VanS
MRYVPTYNFTAAGPPLLTPSTLTPSTLTPSSFAPTGSTPVDATPVTASGTGIVISDVGDVLNTLFIVSSLALLVIGAFGAFLSWIIAGRMLRPLGALTRAAERASGGSLSHRVALTGPDDEFTRLSKTFDDMLDRLERSFTAHERFAANASHELRTPLVTTKALLDVGRDEPDPRRLPLLIERLSETNDRSLRIVEAMLDLSDTARTEITVEPVDLRAIVDAELAAIDHEAVAAGVTFDVHERRPEAGATTPLGDPVLLGQLVGNLLTNAVRHNDERGLATVTIERREGADRPASLTIENTGPEVSSKQLALLSEPFYRARGRVTTPPNARGAMPETHGLGLALVANIVEVHGGTLLLEARSGGGLVVTACLPSSAGPSLSAGRATLSTTGGSIVDSRKGTAS